MTAPQLETATLHLKPDPRLIVALDVPTAIEGLRLAEQLGDTVCFYKIGLGMLTGGGLALAMELKEKGHQVFLDMKLFDIPATIEAAARGLCAYDLDFLTVHGDPHVVSAATQGRGDRKTKILAVTILTALDRNDLDLSLIRDGALSEIAVERARRAFHAGADGVITSPLEAAAIAALPEARGKAIVTPGIRPAGSRSNDQKRTATPPEAIAAGATHLVVGRPITMAADPAAAARDITASLPRS